MPRRPGGQIQPRPYPLEPLVKLIGPNARAVLRTDLRDWRRWTAEGLTERQADRLAVRAGFVPHEVWPELGDRLVDAALVDCASSSCSVRFLPNERAGRGHRFCSSRCYQREWARSKRASDPGYAERQREIRRQYYQECGEYERARQRAAYRRKRAA